MLLEAFAKVIKKKNHKKIINIKKNNHGI